MTTDATGRSLSALWLLDRRQVRVPSRWGREVGAVGDRGARAHRMVGNGPSGNVCKQTGSYCVNSRTGIFVRSSPIEKQVTNELYTIDTQLSGNSAAVPIGYRW